MNIFFYILLFDSLFIISLFLNLICQVLLLHNFKILFLRYEYFTFYFIISLYIILVVSSFTSAFTAISYSACSSNSSKFEKGKGNGSTSTQCCTSTTTSKSFTSALTGPIGCITCFPSSLQERKRKRVWERYSSTCSSTCPSTCTSTYTSSITSEPFTSALAGPIGCIACFPSSL